MTTLSRPVVDNAMNRTMVGVIRCDSCYTEQVFDDPLEALKARGTWLTADDVPMGLRIGKWAVATPAGDFCSLACLLKAMWLVNGSTSQAAKDLVALGA